MPTRANLAATVVATAPSPASSGTTLTVATGKGARFSTPPFNATIGPAGVSTVAFAEQAEIVRVTKVTGDELTIQRAFEGPNPARAIAAADVVAETITLNEVESSLIVAPAPSGGDDSKAIQECYEAMGKYGVLQLRAGTYKFDSGVKFRKYAVTLRGHGASQIGNETGESQIVTAGTLITCNSKNTPAIEATFSGNTFEDFALLNNTNTELATLSAELNASGAAITELPVKATAEAIPNNTEVMTLSGAGPLELGSTLSEGLVSGGGAITKLKITALPGTLLASSTGAGQETVITLNDGAGHTETWKLEAAAVAGALELKVGSAKPKFSFPIGTKVESGNMIQYWKLSAEAAKGATGLKVTSQKPNFSYRTNSVVEGGPFPGSYGMLFTRTNAAGEEKKTFGDSRGRISRVDIEGFYTGCESIGGFQELYQGCHFSGHIGYGLSVGDPGSPDAGERAVISCWFCSTKKRRCKAHIQWGSGGGMFIAYNEILFNIECLHTRAFAEYGINFEWKLAKTSTSEFTVIGNHVDGFEKAGIRFFSEPVEGVLQSVGITNNHIRSYAAELVSSGLVVEGALPGLFVGVTITGNRVGECTNAIKLKNCGYQSVGNTALSPIGQFMVLEGTCENVVAGYPGFSDANTAQPLTIGSGGAGGKAEFGILHNNLWIQLTAEAKANELIEYLVQVATKNYGIFKTKAPTLTIFGYLTAEPVGEVAELKTKPLTNLIKSGVTFRVQNETGETETFKTTALAKAGAEKIEIEKKTSATTLPVESIVEENAPEKFFIPLGNYFLPAGQTMTVTRQDTNTYRILAARVTAP